MPTDMSAYDPFTHRGTCSPFWLLTVEGRTLCVTAASVCQASGLLTPTKKKWRVPRSAAFELGARSLGDRHVFQPANKFDAPTAERIRKALRHVPFYQFNTSILSTSTLQLILKEQNRDARLQLEFAKFAERAALACLAQDDTTHEARQQALLHEADAVKVEAKQHGGVFKKLPATHPGIRASVLFLEQACAVSASQVSADIAPWKSIVSATPKKRFSETKRYFVRFVDFCQSFPTRSISLFDRS